jgi:pimeloyl-ACP methyl ester carboxylesterase
MARRRKRRALVVGAALASAALAALTAHSRRVVARAEAAFPALGDLIDVGGGEKLHVIEHGGGSPVVLIHGADGISLSFTETVTEDIAAAGFRTLAVDRPGHGYSTLPSRVRPDLAYDVDVIRRAIRALGVERPIVLGHSYGGAVAMRWALDHPGEVRALVLLAPVAAFPWPYPAWILRVAHVPVVGRVLTDALVVPLGRPVFDYAASHGFSPGPIPERYTAYGRALYVRPAQFRALAAEYASLKGDAHDLAPRFGDLALPVEIVAAECDRVTRPEYHARPLAQLVPGASYVELADAGHEFMWEHPGAVVDAVKRADERSRQTSSAEPSPSATQRSR